jgi:integrase
MAPGKVILFFERCYRMEISSQYDLKPFFEWLNTSGISSGTAMAYVAGVKDFATWFGETNSEAFDPAKMAPTDIREYQQYLVTAKQLRPATTNRRNAALRKYFAWAKESGLVAETPRFPKPVREQAGAEQAPAGGGAKLCPGHGNSPASCRSGPPACRDAGVKNN